MTSAQSSSCHEAASFSWKIRSVITIVFLLVNVSIAKPEGRKEPSIIIVGAGISGVGAATRLIEHGFTNLKILEAENRIGGRVYSVKTGNWTVDLGAQWVHGGSGNAVYDLAAPLMLLENKTDDFPNGVTLFSDNVELENDLIMKIWDQEEDIFDESLLAIYNGSLFDFLQERLSTVIKKEIKDEKRADAYLRWILRAFCDFEGCDSLEDVSAKGVTEYQYIEGSPLITWKGNGYKTIIDLLLKSHEKSECPPINLDDKLHLKTEVKKITQGNGGIQVDTEDGTSFTADLVIVTVSLAVLKEKLDTLFEPPLPQYKSQAIEGLGIGTVDKIILRFPHAWWPSNITGFDVIRLDKEKPLDEGHFSWEYEILYFMSDEGSPFTLAAWINGEAAKSMETHSLEDVKRGALNVLREFLGHKYSIPEPIEVLRSTWGTNPHFRGSYSYRSMASESMNVSAADLAKPVTDKNGKEVILFAGEATSSGHYSTVHGALETGWREADRIIRMYK